MQNKTFPALEVIYLPTDHTSLGAASLGSANPAAEVADNDLATGRIVSALSHSPYWSSTAVFVTEDDPQSGIDHVNVHRTIGLVASPFVKPGVQSAIRPGRHVAHDGANPAAATHDGVRRERAADERPVSIDAGGERRLRGPSAGCRATVAGRRRGPGPVVGSVDRREQPDLVVLDLRIADVLAPEVCTRLRSAAPQARVVILTAFDDDALLRACLNVGASGVLLKDAHGLDLIDALRRVRSGETVMDKRLDSQPRPLRVGDDTLVDPLTPREHEVLRLMAQGLIGKEIASELSLAPNTVRSYSQSVLSKLHANNRVQALATAKRLRLL